MERWEHDAFLGYMAECEGDRLIAKITQDMMSDICSGFSEEYIVEHYGKKIGYDAAEEIYQELKDQYL